MFREIRRRDRAIPEADARRILERAEYGVLATVGEDGWPYAVPLNHVVDGDVIYMHCATEGHKLENLSHQEKVSYCAVASFRTLPERLSTLYESAVVFGRAAVVTDPVEKRKALDLLGQRFCADFPAQVEDAIRRTGDHTLIVRIQIERITGKAHRPAGDGAV